MTESIKQFEIERIRLINKLEYGLFTNQNDAQKAQLRLNELNALIDNHQANYS